MITSKPANDNHLKTGQRDRIQNDSVVPRRGWRRQVFSTSFYSLMDCLV
jgi:hypothetical protein